MGLEKERSDTRIIMNDDEFNRSFEPILPKKEKEVAAPDRDPHDINSHIKVNFEDVIAEPAGTHSFDKVWVCSHAVFELVKYLFYAFLTTVLAIPLSFVAGIYFALISAIHIWILMPCVKTCLMALPPVKAIWKSLVDMFISPFFESIGKCLSSFKINKMQD